MNYLDIANLEIETFLFFCDQADALDKYEEQEMKKARGSKR